MTFNPATNEKPFALLPKGDRVILRKAIGDRGGQVWSHYMGWTDLETSQMQPDEVYRALPVVKSSWHNVYPDADWMDVSPAYPDRLEADQCASLSRIGVARFDLIDGKLSVTLEPLEDKP